MGGSAGDIKDVQLGPGLDFDGIARENLLPCYCRSLKSTLPSNPFSACWPAYQGRGLRRLGCRVHREEGKMTERQLVRLPAMQKRWILSSGMLYELLAVHMNALENGLPFPFWGVCQEQGV